MERTSASPQFYWELPLAERARIDREPLREEEEGWLAYDINWGRRLIACCPGEPPTWPDLDPEPEHGIHTESYSDPIGAILAAAAYVGLSEEEIISDAVARLRSGRRWAEDAVRRRTEQASALGRENGADADGHPGQESIAITVHLHEWRQMGLPPERIGSFTVVNYVPDGDDGPATGPSEVASRIWNFLCCARRPLGPGLCISIVPAGRPRLQPRDAGSGFGSVGGYGEIENALRALQARLTAPDGRAPDGGGQ
jgi:hypothetical protein